VSPRGGLNICGKSLPHWDLIPKSKILFTYHIEPCFNVEVSASGKMSWVTFIEDLKFMKTNTNS
jgi:hypothetical protein